MTTVKVDFYKEGGKWYTSDEFTLPREYYSTQELEAAIRNRPQGVIVDEMSYTFEAWDDNGAMNKRLVITGK